MTIAEGLRSGIKSGVSGLYYVAGAVAGIYLALLHILYDHNRLNPVSSSLKSFASMLVSCTPLASDVPKQPLAGAAEQNITHEGEARSSALKAQPATTMQAEALPISVPQQLVDMDTPPTAGGRKPIAEEAPTSVLQSAVQGPSTPPEGPQPQPPNQHSLANAARPETVPVAISNVPADTVPLVSSQQVSTGVHYANADQAQPPLATQRNQPAPLTPRKEEPTPTESSKQEPGAAPQAALRGHVVPTLPTVLPLPPMAYMAMPKQAASIPVPRVSATSDAGSDMSSASGWKLNHSQCWHQEGQKVRRSYTWHSVDSVDCCHLYHCTWTEGL
mmetsp:Transcript_32970/g.72894  ORF Transcript_32970/g.72894 Transcript_32970/m.72894 type:complete len:331 (-) Transcript_32970:103-1095(-)